jgi:hypothetical protein
MAAARWSQETGWLCCHECNLWSIDPAAGQHVDCEAPEPVRAGVVRSSDRAQSGFAMKFRSRKQ